MQKIYRLAANASFNYIYRHGTRCSTPLFTVCYVTAHSIKVGISVNKKVGNSVTRSRVKRLIKENFRKLIPALKGTHNYVVTAKEGVADATYHDVERHLIGALKRMGHLEKTVEGNL